MEAFEEKEKGGRELEVIRDIVELGRDRHRKVRETKNDGLSSQ